MGLLDICVNYNRRSKESVKSTGSLAAVLAIGALLAAPAAAQTPLVVGAVRDQHGIPIAGARVQGFDVRGDSRSDGLTDADGTFALSGDGVAQISITCRYCLTRRYSASPGRPVVAIVRRFDALVSDGPSPADLAALPYAHVESALALRPFTLLRQSSGLFGDQLSDRGLFPGNALVVDAGVPDYDVAFGSSPYAVIPATYQTGAEIQLPANAFLYGDRAGSGAVGLDPFAVPNGAAALAGGDAIARAGFGDDRVAAAAATSSNDDESRQRADLRWTVPLSDAQSLSFAGGSAQGRQFGAPSAAQNSQFTFADAAFDDALPAIDLRAGFVADRGTYAADAGDRPISDTWSDAQYSVGARTVGPLSAFADASLRSSTGIYDAAAYLAPRIAGTLEQTRFDAGIESSGNAYDVTAGVGWFEFGYTGGTGGISSDSGGRLATPSLQLGLFPNGPWTAQVQIAEAFVLPTLWQQYASYEGPPAYDRTSLQALTLSYTDGARLRAAAEVSWQNVTGSVSGPIGSAGASLTWQMSPAIAMRAWTMHVADATVSPGAIAYPFGGTPSTVGALWFTYDNAGALRFDAVYRRDVLEGAPFFHLDGSVSGPITSRLRWYAGVEDRQRTTYLDAGIRF